MENNILGAFRAQDRVGTVVRPYCFEQFDLRHARVERAVFVLRFASVVTHEDAQFNKQS